MWNIRLTSSLLNAAILIYILRKISKIKFKTFEGFILFLLLSFNLIIFFNMNAIIRLLVYVFLVVFFMKFFYKIDIYQGIIISIISYLLNVTSDTFSGIIMLFLFKCKPHDILSNIYLVFVLYILIFFAVIIQLFILNKLKGFLQIDDDENNEINITTVLYVILTCVIIAFNIIIFKYVPKEFVNKYVMVFFLLILAYFILNIYVIYINNKYVIQKTENENLKSNLEEIGHFIENIRKFRHDYNNTLSAIDGYISNDDLLGLKEYFYSEILQDSKVLYNNDNIIKIQHIKNSAIKGIISSKIIVAENFNLNINIEILGEVNYLSMRNIDICKILGILLDNAIEAAFDSCEKYIFIGIMVEDNTTEFIIENSYKNKPIISEMFKKGYSTKGNNRGLGLYTLKYIINKEYNNILLNTFVHNNKLKQELIIEKSES